MAGMNRPNSTRRRLSLQQLGAPRPSRQLSRDPSRDSHHKSHALATESSPMRRPPALLPHQVAAAALFALSLPPAPTQAQGTRFLRQPDVSATHIVFTHANEPLEGRARRGRRDPPHQLRRRRDRRRLQPGWTLDRIFRPVRRQHRRLPDVCRGRTASAAHLAPCCGCRAGVDARRRHSLPVGTRRCPHAALEVLHGAPGGRLA